MSAIVLFVELKLVPGARENFLARARQHREKVLENEPGCHRFDLLEQQGKPAADGLAAWTVGKCGTGCWRRCRY